MKPKQLALLELRDEFLKPFDQVFDEILSTQFPDFYRKTGIDFVKGSYPKCNIIDNDINIQILAEIPGIPKEDVNINVENNILTISGKNKKPSSDAFFYNEEKFVKYIRRELKHSSFKRSFELGTNLDTDNISANFVNGLLDIKIPKKEIKTKKTINVKIN